MRSLETSVTYCCVVKLMLTNVSEVHTASDIRAMMEAVRASETLVNINFTTRHYIPEDSKRHTRLLENMKSHMDLCSLEYNLMEGCCEHVN
jgi:hypothetical protein